MSSRYLCTSPYLKFKPGLIYSFERTSHIYRGDNWFNIKTYSTRICYEHNGMNIAKHSLRKHFKFIPSK